MQESRYRVSLNLTPAQHIQLAEFIEAVIDNGLVPSYGVQPTTSATVGNGHYQRPDPNSKEQLDKQYPGISGQPPRMPEADTANGAEPSTSPNNATVSSGERVDVRGVVWHADWHAGDYATNKDGSWRRRKNTDLIEHAKYEGPFLKAKKSAVAAVLAETVKPALTKAPPPAVKIAPPPVIEAEGVPGVAEFETLWAKLVLEERVNPDIENWFEAEFGGHPTRSFVYRTDPAKRLAAFNQMKYYAT